MNRENKQDNIRKNEHKRLNKTKVIKISLSLFVVIIFVILFAVSLQIFKTTKTGVEVTKNLAESATETFEYSEDEQTEEAEFAETSHTQLGFDVTAVDEDTSIDSYTLASESTLYKQSTSELTSRLIYSDTNSVEYDELSNDSTIIDVYMEFTEPSWTGFTASGSAIVSLELQTRR